MSQSRNTAKQNLRKRLTSQKCQTGCIEPPNELRNHVHLRNLALIHVALITSLMQRIAGSVVTNDRHHGARRGIYGAHEFYTQPNPVANPY